MLGTRFGSAALGVTLLLAACGRAEDVPRGDAPWRAQLDEAEDAAEIAALGERWLALARSHGSRWEPSWAAGEAFLRIEDARAHGALEAAGSRATASGEPTGVALAENGLGWLDYARGDLAAAERRYEIALDAARRSERKDVEGFVENNRAGVYFAQGRFDRARGALEAAERGLVAAGKPEIARGLAFNRAVVLAELGDARAARTLLEGVHERARREAEPWEADASALVLGDIHLALAEPAAAERWFTAVSGAHADLDVLARFGRGRSRLMTGDAEGSRSLFGEALARARTGAPRFAPIAETYAAEVRHRSGDHEGAARELRRIAAEADRDGFGQVSWTARWFLGRMLVTEGRPAEAVPVLAEAVEHVERQGSSLDPFEAGFQFLRERAEPYVELATAQAAGGEARALEDVLATSRRAKARALRAGIGPARAGSLAALRASLQPGDLVLDVLAGEGRGVVLAVSPHGARAETIPGLAVLRPLLAAWRAGSDAARRQLGDALLRPVADLLQGAQRVHVSPDRDLALVPFAALADPATGRHLVESVEIALLPVADAAAVPRLAGPIVLAGRPELAPADRLPELPWSGYELSALRDLWGDAAGVVLAGRDLSPARLRAAPLRRAGIVHLATHALASTRDPRRCAIVLSRGARLGVDEVARLPLGPGLVVLSACRTGEGEVLPGEGVVGLGWAFLRAGAAGVVATTWTIEDRSTAELMIDLHRFLKEGDAPARALARAQRHAAASGVPASRWAPFVLILRPGAATP